MNVSESVPNKQSKTPIRKGGRHPLIAWLVSCCRPLVVDDHDQKEEQLPIIPVETPIKNDQDDGNEKSLDSGLIQVARYVARPSIPAGLAGTTDNQEGLCTAVSIGPHCLSLNKSLEIQILSNNFQEVGPPRVCQDQEAHPVDSQDISPNIMYSKSMDDNGKRGRSHSIHGSLYLSSPPVLNCHAKLESCSRTSSRHSPILGMADLYHGHRGDENKAKNLYNKEDARRDVQYSLQSERMRHLLTQRQRVTNEIWHVTTALKHPGCGVGSSNGYQMEKDPKYYGILNDSIISLQERDRFISDSKTTLALIDMEIQNVFRN